MDGGGAREDRRILAFSADEERGLDDMRQFTTELNRLAKSKFRQRFRLKEAELKQLRREGIARILDQGRRFLRERLAPALPENDGKQTPMKGHPVFVAQHATATCCRGCLAKWYGIPPARELTDTEIEWILNLHQAWMERTVGELPSGPPQLFE